MAAGKDDATAPTLANDATLPSDSSARSIPSDVGSLATVSASAYTILGEHGRGGLGRILRARDERTGRVVAIKEVLAGHDEAAARFVREALVTANLQHPAIVPVYEVGRWPNGQPFYAMKLVAGRTLSAAITETKDRLALLPHVASVADALAYAHEAGVIHRDLKPSNVLVGSFGETVVIDWGLAKRIGDEHDLPLPEIATGETISGSVMGTPAYMPPEQAIGGDVDARSDVYAIGAMIYHLLAGAPPYADSKDGNDVITRVRTGKPPAPLPDEVAPDLRAIVAKAMQRSPDLRYPTAAELAADLRAFMTGGLVGAHRYTTRQRWARWIKRHRAPVAVAALATIALAAFGTYSIVRIVRARAAAEDARAAAEQQRASAEELISFMVVDLQGRLAKVGRLDLLEPVARKAIEHYAKASAHDVTIGEARAHHSLAMVLQQKGDNDAALSEFELTRGLLATLSARSPDDLKLRRDTSVADDNIADLLVSRGDSKGALERYRGALAVFEDLTKRDPKQRQYAQDVAFVHLRIGMVLETRGDPKAALDEYRAARAIDEQISAANPDDLKVQTSLSGLDNRIGDTLQALGDKDGALESFEAARDTAIAIAAKDPTGDHERDVMVALNKLGVLHRARGERDQAAALTREALDIARGLASRDPDNAIWQRDVEINQGQAGGDLLKDGKLDDAQHLYEDSLAIATRLAARDPKNADAQFDLASAHDRLGNLELARKQPDRAAERYRTSLAIREREAARDPQDASWRRGLAISHAKLGGVAMARGDKAAAADAFREAIAILEPLAAKDPETAKDLADLRAELAQALAH